MVQQFGRENHVTQPPKKGGTIFFPISFPFGTSKLSIARSFITDSPFFSSFFSPPTLAQLFPCPLGRAKAPLWAPGSAGHVRAAAAPLRVRAGRQGDLERPAAASGGGGPAMTGKGKGPPKW